MSTAIRRYDDVLNVDVLLLRMNWPSIPIESIEHVGNGVIPSCPADSERPPDPALLAERLYD